jgi:hypothetical protein
MSSAVERRAKERLDEQLRKRSGERDQLTPGAEILIAWINKDIKDVGSMETKILGMDFDELRSMIPLAARMNVDNKDLLMAQVLAQAMHIEWLKSAKNRLKNTLRVAKRADKEAEEARNAELPQAWQDAAKTPAPEPKK